jgi:uncharacterized protein (DUF983 family)
MDDDSFCAPATMCERCGGDYDLVSMRTAKGPAMVDVCPVCDLGVLNLPARAPATGADATEPVPDQ